MKNNTNCSTSNHSSSNDSFNNTNAATTTTNDDNDSDTSNNKELSQPKRFEASEQVLAVLEKEVCETYCRAQAKAVLLYNRPDLKDRLGHGRVVGHKDKQQYTR